MLKGKMLQDSRLTSPVFWGGAFERVVGDGAGASHPALLGYEKRGVSSMARGVSMARPRGDVTVYLMVGLLLLLLVLIVVMLLILKDE